MALLMKLKMSGKVNVAMRGRPDGNGYNQRLEIGNDIHTNTITSVSKDNLIIQTPIDLSLKNPQAVERANCISARQDRGISNRSKEGTGVLMSSVKFMTGGVSHDWSRN